MRTRASRKPNSRSQARSFKPKHRATEMDVQVGRRVRAIRLERDMSQSTLGKLLGVTFQQVQKYEKGVNRIGAGRLQSLAEIFEVPISAFFAEKDEPADHKATLFDLADSSGALSLLRAYANIPEPRLKRSLVQMANAIAAGQESRD